MNYSTYTRRILGHFLYSSTLCLFLILPGISGCGGDNEETSDDQDPSKNLVGTWELITIDGKTPKAYFQQDIGDEEIELLDSAGKVVFASDGSLFQEVLLTVRILIESSPDLIYLRMRMGITIKGSYVVSGSTVEFIQSGDAINAEAHISWETPGNPELTQQLEQLLDWEQKSQEAAAELEQEFARDFGLELDTHTFDLEDNILTLMNGSVNVYRKR